VSLGGKVCLPRIFSKKKNVHKGNTKKKKKMQSTRHGPAPLAQRKAYRGRRTTEMNQIDESLLTLPPPSEEKEQEEEAIEILYVFSTFPYHHLLLTKSCMH